MPFTQTSLHCHYLCTVRDDYSRYILSWRLAATMGSRDVEEPLTLAVAKTSVQHIKVRQRPRLLSDNGTAFVADVLKKHLKHYRMKHIRGAPSHPQTPDMIERYHRSMKSPVKLDIYYAPADWEHAIAHFVRYYNNERYHESLNNVTPANMY